MVTVHLDEGVAMTLLRRVRAAVGLGVTWAVVWGLAGFATFMGAFLAMEPYQRARVGWTTAASLAAPAAVVSGIFGLVGGVLFAFALGFAERRRSIDEISIPRTAALGALAGLGLWVATSPSLGLLAGSLVAGGVFTAFGAISAAATLAVARRGSLSAASEPLYLPGEVE